jgi:large subunit ribosomal protein L21
LLDIWQGIQGGILAAISTCSATAFNIELPPFKSQPQDNSQERNMYAVIVSGGKQHRVEPGELLKLEKLDVPTGDSIDFDKILLVADGEAIKVGAPYVDGGKVSAEVVAHGRADKVKIIKFRRRKHHRKQMGHRQWYTEVKITGISAG